MNLPYRTVYVLVFLIGVYIPAGLALNRSWNGVLDHGLLMTLVLGSMLLLVNGARLDKRMAMQGKLLVISALLALLSAYYHGSLSSAFPVFGLTASFLVFSGAANLINKPDRFGFQLCAWSAAAGTGMLAFALTIESFTWIRYSGYTHNANSFSWLCSVTAAISLGLLLVTPKKHTVKLSGGMLVFSVSLTLLFATNTRAAAIAVIAAYIAYVFVRILAPRRNFRKDGISGGFRDVSVFILVSLILSIIVYIDGLDSILKKFIITMSKGDISQGRFDSWLISLESANLLGHGPKYTETLAFQGSAGHNIFIHLLSAYGVFVSIFIFLFFASVWMDLARIVKRSGIKLAVPAFIVLTSFLVQAGASVTLVAPGLWLSLALYAVIKRCELVRCLHRQRKVLA